MDIKNIPTSFWHAVSFCMIVATLGLLFIAYASSSVSIEIANAKIELSSAISQTKDIKNDLANENQRLVEANERLAEKVALLEEKTQSSSGITAEELNIAEIIVERPISTVEPNRVVTDPKWLIELDNKINTAQDYLAK